MFPVRMMCRLLGVSPSGYYAWRYRKPSSRAVSDASLLERISEIHARSYGTYGAPRIHAELAAQGVHVARKRVARLMKMAGLQGVSRRKRAFTTRRDSTSRPAPDLVNRDFSAKGPNQLWVADITYIPTWAGFLGLAVVIFVLSRRVVGWAMDNHLRTELVLHALRRLSSSGSRATSSIIPTKGANTPPSPSASGAKMPVFAPLWALSATASIAPAAKASSPPSNASCWIADPSGPTKRTRLQSSPSSRVGTTLTACTLPSATNHPSTSKGALCFIPPTQVLTCPLNRGNSTLSCGGGYRQAMGVAIQDL